MLFRIDRYMYLFLAIQEIVSKATCESNKDTNKQTNRTSTAKLRIVEGAPPITVQFQVEGPLTPGQFTHGTVKIARKARISELKKEIEITIGRKDFFLMFMGYRLAMGDMVGERIREGQKVFVIGSWNTKDPQPAKPKSRQSDQGFNLSIGAPERHTTLQYIVTESTLGSSVQDQVAT